MDADLDRAAFPDDAAHLRALLAERDAVIAERDAALRRATRICGTRGSRSRS